MCSLEFVLAAMVYQQLYPAGFINAAFGTKRVLLAYLSAAPGAAA